MVWSVSWGLQLTFLPYFNFWNLIFDCCWVGNDFLQLLTDMRSSFSSFSLLLADTPVSAASGPLRHFRSAAGIRIARGLWASLQTLGAFSILVSISGTRALWYLPAWVTESGLGLALRRSTAWCDPRTRLNRMQRAASGIARGRKSHEQPEILGAYSLFLSASGFWTNFKRKRTSFLNLAPGGRQDRSHTAWWRTYYLYAVQNKLGQCK